MFNTDINIGLAAKFKKEADIILASSNTTEKLLIQNKYQDIINILETLDRTYPACDEDVDIILDYINNIWNKGILSPLTLNDDEFENYSNNGIRQNKRYPYIYMNEDSTIINNNAYNLYIRSSYEHKENIQVKITPHIIKGNHLIYINKGGVVTGEYINTCFIKKSIINEHNFDVKSPLNIPVSIIYDKDINIYTMDHRCPIIAILQKTYAIPIKNDDYIKNKKYNIRKYKKLDK